ncbi:MAG: DNA repair protein RecO [Acidobacteria bacterium]|nr:DNA repair protein RecO [Acidobacteriota bacterium]
MPTHGADAIVLRTYRYGEADRIVVFLTQDRGKRRGVAKNATKSRRRFGGALESLTLGRVSYVEREGRELVLLERIEPIESPLRAAMGRGDGDAASVLGHASYFAELLDAWSPDAMANERLFRLGASVGEALCRGGSVECLARYFEYWLLRLEGVYPALGGCARCGESLAAGAVLVTGEWHMVCRGCGTGPLKVSREAMAILRQLATWTPAAVTQSGADVGALRELEAVHARLIAMHLDKDLRSARVVRELRP